MHTKAAAAISPKSTAHPTAPPIAAVLLMMSPLLSLFGGADIIVPGMSKRIRIRMTGKYRRRRMRIRVSYRCILLRKNCT